VDNLANAAVSGSGADVTAVAPPVTVNIGGTAPTVATLTLPNDMDTDAITTMAVLNADGTLTPVPTRVNADGSVVVLASGNVTLVPLSVEAHFTDLLFTEQYVDVAEEINRAASLMIVVGHGNGIFAPNDQVTEQQAVTMFLRAMGVPVAYETALTTGQAHGLNAATAIPTAPMTRIDTAVLIVNALKDVGMKPSVTAAEANTLLAGFTDVSGLTTAERDSLAICVKLGIFKGYGNGKIGPDEILLRSHMASLAVRLQDVMLGTVSE
jgi:hypothetical protein